MSGVADTLTAEARESSGPPALTRDGPRPRVNLLREVVTLLDTQRIPHALIGAAAMALHGVSREEADAIRAEVESALPKLPPECRVLWNRVRSGH